MTGLDTIVEQILQEAQKEAEEIKAKFEAEGAKVTVK